MRIVFMRTVNFESESDKFSQFMCISYRITMMEADKLWSRGVKKLRAVEIFRKLRSCDVRVRFFWRESQKI